MGFSDLLRGTPGRRFTAHYRRRRQPLLRALAMAGGTALMIVGALMFVTPGPGLIVFLAGGVLLARESRRAARWLDRAELRVRSWLRIPPER
jgi:hypothetical protein